jgi:predicted O-methyltransferase YrrM
LEFINEINSQKNEGIYDFKNLKKDNIIEINLPRPYNRYKTEIDNVVNLILKKEKNMENQKEIKIKELLLTPRMFYADYAHRHNQLKGLKMLIDEYLNDNTVMVEIGSFAGVSSELFALHCKELYCVDLWDPYWEITDKQRTEFAEFSFDNMIKNYENVYKVKKSSVEASKDFKDGSLDLVYIDAAHDYDSVRQDILTWLPKIKKGGFIAGHDYRYDPNIGVYDAVNDIFVNDYKIISFPDSSFIITV